MAKTLVALYDTCTDAERVMQELITDGLRCGKVDPEAL